MATGHSPTKQEDITDRSPVTGHRSTGQYSDDYKSVNHWSQIIKSPVIGLRKNDSKDKSVFTGQPVTGHQHIYQPLVNDTHAIGMEFTTNRSNLCSEHSYRHEVQNPTNNSKRVLLPLEPDFSNMSDPSVVIEPPGNNWRSDNKQTSQTSISKSRRKHESKKRRRHRSCSTSSSSRSVSSDSRKRKSKRSKHSHKKRKRRLTSSFSSTSDNQSDNYSRYKRSRHSPQAVETPIMLQPAEITNVPTIPQPEHVIQHSTKDRLRIGDGDLVL